ncbi:MAG: DUF3822 family protein [Bacteroidales bacterium]|nr:DUF3822 family protein [Bacteroidales bacterium]
MPDQYTIALNLQDESFNPQDTGNYGLALVMNEYGISCCTLDFRRNKFLGLYRFNRVDSKSMGAPVNTDTSFKGFVDGVFIALPWMKNPFKQVKIAFDGKETTLVPAFLFDPGEKERYFRFNFQQDQEDMVFGDHLKPLDAWQVFAVPEFILETTSAVFPGIKVVHSSSLLIESIWINYKNRINKPHVFLHVREHLFDMMIFDGCRMTYFNTFSFQNAEDVTYYLIFVMEQLNFNPETIPLILLGHVDLEDGLCELLHKYVRNIETVRRNEAYRYSYMLNQLPPQTCFPLLNFFSCGL